MSLRAMSKSLPALAQSSNEVFAFLFDLVNLLTRVFGLFDVLRDFFGQMK